MNIVIYRSFIIHSFVLFYEVHTISVVTKGSKIGLLGANGTEIECLYTRENITHIFFVSFMAFNRNRNIFTEIAIYTPEHKPELTNDGKYLEGRVTLTPITKLSTKTVLTVNKLVCIDDTSYQCKVSYLNSSGSQNQISNNISISVQVPPSKPDKVEIISSPMDVSTTTDRTRNKTSTLSETESVYTSTPTESGSVYTSTPTESESVYTSTPTESESVYTSTWSGTENSTVITSPRSDKNPTTSLQNFGSPIVDNNITSTTISFYNSTSGNEPTTVAQSIMEGNNITVRCSGNVGKPAGIFIFKKFLKDHTPSIDYNATTSETEKIPENCSYCRTSYLNLKVTAEDNQAVIRCVVVSLLAEQDMYMDSKQLEVKYNVRIPTMTKYPDKQEYVVGADTSITLTCTTDGNPKPIYHWYKDNHDDNISTAENFTLKNINTTDSGLYICNVSNTINGLTYTEAAQMEVHIMNKADKSTTQSTSTGSSSGAGADDTNENSSVAVIGGVFGAVVSLIVIISVITYYLHKRRKKTSETPLLNIESQEGDGSKSKPIAESRTGSFDYIALEEDVNKTQTANDGHEVDEIGEHNKEYLKKQEEEEQKMKESNSLPQPAAYDQLNEATKSKNKQNTETPELANKQEEDTNVESQEGTNDEAGEKENEKNEHFDTSNNSSKQNSDGDTKLSNQTSQIESYNNKAFEKDENRKVATVSPTVRSSGGSQNNEQTNQNRHSQSKEGYENVIAKDQTDISEGDISHRTALKN